MSVDRTQPNPELVSAVASLLTTLRAAGVKRSREYAGLKAELRPRGFRPFDIFATYQFVAGSTRGDWPASVRLAAYVANRR